MAKALDTTTFEYTVKEQQAEQLMAALEKAKPKKRKQILPALNEEFVQLKDVELIREEMEEPPKRVTRSTRLKVVVIKEKEENEVYSDDDDCIVVALVKI